MRSVLWKQNNMNFRLLKTLVSISIFFIIILIIEWAYMKHSQKNIDIGMKNVSVNTIETEDLQNIKLKEHDSDYYSDLVERPLFNRNRKPIETLAEEIPKETEKKRI